MLIEPVIVLLVLVGLGEFFVAFVPGPSTRHTRLSAFASA